MLRRPLAGLAAAALGRVPSDGEWRGLPGQTQRGRAEVGAPGLGVVPLAAPVLPERRPGPAGGVAGCGSGALRSVVDRAGLGACGCLRPGVGSAALVLIAWVITSRVPRVSPLDVPGNSAQVRVPDDCTLDAVVEPAGCGGPERGSNLTALPQAGRRHRTPGSSGRCGF